MEEGLAGAKASDLLRLGSDTAGGLGLGEAGFAVGGRARTEEGGGARVEDRGRSGLWISCTALGTLQLFEGVVGAEVGMALTEGGVASEAPPGCLCTLLVIELKTSTVLTPSGGMAGAEGGVVKVRAGLGALQPVGGAVGAVAHSLRLLASFFSLETPGEGKEVQEEDAPPPL